MTKHTIRLDQNGNKTVIFDYVMGTGKTSLAINLINQNPQHKYLFITPFKTEVDRIVNSCNNFYKPEKEKGNGRKQTHFFKLLREGKNIATTHSLFRDLDMSNPDIELLKDYNLFIDEVVDVIDLINEKPNDVEMLIRDSVISIGTEETGRHVSVIKEDYAGRFEDTLNRIRSGNVRLFGGNTLIWMFPSKVFEIVNSTVILTYLFEGSMMHSYLLINKIGFNINYRGLISTPQRKSISDLITVYEGRYNRIGKGRGNKKPLTKSWYEKATKDQLNRLGNNIRNVGRHYGIDSEYIALTTFKDHAYVTETKDRITFKKDSLVPKGYRAGTFISLGTRATNKHSHKQLMMYLIDRRMNPVLKRFIGSYGITVNEDLFALSDLIQWLWRGSIRTDNKMTIYLPSFRMRELFKFWINNGHQ